MVVSDGFRSISSAGRWPPDVAEETNPAASVGMVAASDLWGRPRAGDRWIQIDPGEDFVIELRFRSSPTGTKGTKGLIVEQKGSSTIHFNIREAADGVRLSAAVVKEGVIRIILETGRIGVHPPHLRLSRCGNQWSIAHSDDGLSWTVGDGFLLPLASTAAGILAKAPAAEIDYLRFQRVVTGRKSAPEADRPSAAGNGMMEANAAASITADITTRILARERFNQRIFSLFMVILFMACALLSSFYAL